MSRVVQIQGERPTFPGDACVHCLQPSTEKVDIVMVKEGYRVRKVSVPFCETCAELRVTKSRRQVQFERLAVTVSLLLALTVGAWTYTRINNLGRWVWGALLGVLVALIVFGVMYMVARPWSWGFRSSETKAALRTVRIRDFDWETTLLEFENQDYAERFAQVNQKE
jgi:putative membrane protein (TIGR04086 family)